MARIEFNSDLVDKLNLSDLEQGMPGITPRFGACLAEAACFCLENQNHGTGVQMKIDGEFRHSLRLQWPACEDKAQRARCWGDSDVATENGAYGIAALVINELTNYRIVERSRKGTGFDFWLGKKGSASLLFQEKARLEVSGIMKGDEQSIAARVRRKMKQISPSDGPLPGVVAVVEFGVPRSRISEK
jgi:hypothetical protein